MNENDCIYKGKWLCKTWKITAEDSFSMFWKGTNYLRIQSDWAVEPLFSVKVLSGHGLHCIWPVKSWYLLTGHCSHTPLEDPKLPNKHGAKLYDKFILIMAQKSLQQYT